MESLAPFNLCVECDEIITNPICGDCLSKEMKIMLGEKDPALAELISHQDIEGDTRCILCHRKMGLCPHCFCKGIYEILREKDQPIATEFLSRFDFELRRDLADFI